LKTRDARVLIFISTILSDGKSSRLYKKIVDDKKMACKLVRLVIVKKITERISFMVYPSTKYSENLLTEIDAEIATDRTNF
jgi:hypothetical protein